jgi:hypothetical protein
MLVTVRRVASVLTGTVAGLVSAAPVAAHGGVTGVQDVVQDYGVLLFLLAVVLIGAGVLTWVMLAPQAEEELPEATEAPEG